MMMHHRLSKRMLMALTVISTLFLGGTPVLLRAAMLEILHDPAASLAGVVFRFWAMPWLVMLLILGITLRLLSVKPPIIIVPEQPIVCEVSV